MTLTTIILSALKRATRDADSDTDEIQDSRIGLAHRRKIGERRVRIAADSRERRYNGRHGGWWRL